MKSVETPQHFSSLSSFIFKVLTRLYHFLRALIFFLISKHNYFVQSEQQNWSYSISQLVNFWFDKSSPPSEVMYFCESCWMIFSISLYIVSDIHFPLLAVNGCNLLCWHIFLFINKICHILWWCVRFYLFFHRIHGEQFFSPSPCNQKLFFLSCFTRYIIFNGNLKLIFNKRNTCLYFIIILLSNPKIYSKEILIFN